MAAGFERVFDIGPVFRADPSHTSRHLTEFVSVDIEMSWIDDVEDVMSFEENWLSFAALSVLSEYRPAIEKNFGRPMREPTPPLPRMELRQAREILERDGYVGPDDGDVDPEGLRRISAYVEEHWSSEFVFLTNYPFALRPFYHMLESQQVHSASIIIPFCTSRRSPSTSIRR
jgi:aspartyl-tRNA synthetase